MNESIEGYRRRVTELNNDILSHRESIEVDEKEIAAIKKRKMLDPTKELKGMIKKIEGDLGDQRKVLQDKIDEKVSNDAWINRFKLFATHLSNKSLKAIEYRTNAYMKKLGS